MYVCNQILSKEASTLNGTVAGSFTRRKRLIKSKLKSVMLTCQPCRSFAYHKIASSMVRSRKGLNQGAEIL